MDTLNAVPDPDRSRPDISQGRDGSVGVERGTVVVPGTEYRYCSFPNMAGANCPLQLCDSDDWFGWH